MPFNLLLMPLVAGYLFLERAYLFAYSTSLLQKEQLLLRASIYGLWFAAAARLLCWAAASTNLGRSFGNFVHELAPFDYVGTALASLVIGLFVRLLVNFLVPRNVAGDWLYHQEKLSPLESTLLRSAIGVPPQLEISKKRLLYVQARGVIDAIAFGARRFNIHRLKLSWTRAGIAVQRARSDSPFPFGDPAPVMITMSDEKVYVGYVDALPPISATDLHYIRLLPIWSGYRKSDTREVIRVTPYLDAIINLDDTSKLQKVLRCADIATVNLFEEDIFPIKDAQDENPSPRE